MLAINSGRSHGAMSPRFTHLLLAPDIAARYSGNLHRRQYPQAAGADLESNGQFPISSPSISTGTLPRCSHAPVWLEVLDLRDEICE